MIKCAFFADSLEDVRLHIIDNLKTIYGPENALRTIIFDQRRGLLIVNAEPHLESLAIVISSCDGASLVGLARPIQNPIEQNLFINFQFNRMIQRELCGVKKVVECLGLGNCPRKTVEDEAVCGVRLGDALDQHGDNELIRHEFTPFHHSLGRFAYVCPRSNSCTQHFTRRQMRNVKLFTNTARLCPLPCSRRSEILMMAVLFFDFDI